MAQKTTLSVTATPGRRYTFTGTVYQVSVTDGVIQSDTTINIATLIASVIDGLKQSDSSGNISTLPAIVTDGMKISDATFHIQATGNVTVTFNIIKSSVTFD